METRLRRAPNRPPLDRRFQLLLPAADGGDVTKYLVRDIANFFWYLKLDETEKLAALRHYLSSNTRTPLSDRELLHLVDAAIAERDEREQA